MSCDKCLKVQTAAVNVHEVAEEMLLENARLTEENNTLRHEFKMLQSGAARLSKSNKELNSTLNYAHAVVEAAMRYVHWETTSNHQTLIEVVKNSNIDFRKGKYD